VPELAAKASWAGRDIYISGPDEMIVKTVRVLKELGAPGELLHYDMPCEGLE
jgi:NAD(P)H-flavin reductase